ncbi:MAG: hypothetical protein R2932_56900 [Caldilineaceae bacterium]
MPTACRLVGKGGAGQKLTTAAPQIANMGTGIIGSFVEADPCNCATHGALEFYAHFDGVGVIFRGNGWGRVIIPNRAGTI